MADRNRDRIIATVATVLLLAVVVGWMVVTRFSVDMSLMSDRTWPPVDLSEIVFGGEFVKFGNMADMTVADVAQPSSATSTEASSHAGNDITNGGEASPEAPTVVASERQSVAKVEKKDTPTKTGPAKEELAEQERIKREQEQAQQSREISKGIKNAFSKPSASAGTSGVASGNSTEGAVSGSPGYSLKGRTAESWGRPSSAFSGTIVIAVKVNRQGVVTQATYSGGSGSAAAQSSVRNSCIAAARQSRFSVDEDAPAEQSGTITWTFR